MNYDYMAFDKKTIAIAADEEGIRYLEFQDGKRPLTIETDWTREPNSFIQDAKKQLGAYLKGELAEFKLTLRPHGTEFQRQVWKRLCEIPLGQTMSYGELARAIGRPTASRAVGAANGQNPIAVIIPCHRVIGKNGKLTGYAGGVDIKSWLLEHEEAGVHA